MERPTISPCNVQICIQYIHVFFISIALKPCIPDNLPLFIPNSITASSTSTRKQHLKGTLSKILIFYGEMGPLSENNTQQAIWTLLKVEISIFPKLPAFDILSAGHSTITTCDIFLSCFPNMISESSF